jgi:activator of 2-hydroxyglutaryl-CoA dehydratase
MNNIYMGVDLGHRNDTTIVIVRPDNISKRFTFITIGPHLEIQDVLSKIATLVEKYEIDLDNVSVPGHRDLEERLRNMFGR